MTNKDLKGLKATEMMKCDGCGQYHPIKDCEVVIVRFIKGKRCELHNHELMDTQPVKNENKETSNTHDTPETRDRKIKMTAEEINMSDNLVDLVKPEDKKKVMPRSIVPAEFMGMNIPPDSQVFEAKGNRITRKV